MELILLYSTRGRFHYFSLGTLAAIAMPKLLVLIPFVSLALIASTQAAAALGPAADLVVSNKMISPDGFARDAVVVNGVYPAPLITAKKVSNPPS